jgi:SAM-dependent MidA family methyltransferase
LSELRTSLGERLRERIKREGPMTFRDWMQAALYDEREGYYCRRDRIRQGRAGDYRTAPETSPLFAATFARYFATLFNELGSPSRFTIVEVGAGSGEFAGGVLTALQTNHPDIFAGLDYLIDEVSAGSRELIAARLFEFSDRVIVRSPTVREGKLLDLALPDGRASDTITGIIFSNELIDAFPVHRVTMRDGVLRELCVGFEEGRFVWTECEPSAAVKDYCRQIKLELSQGQIVEINLDAGAFVGRAASSLQSGYLITVDYGDERDELLHAPHRQPGTLRAFHRHQLIDDLLSHPGEVDLTTTIDWTQMKEAGARNGLETLRLQQLDQFLLSEGLLEALTDTSRYITDTVELLRLQTSAREMILPTGLAASFQVLVQRKNS